MSSLYQKSVDVIKCGQSPSGAYIASPNFPTYHYCWLRDGSFIAHAMDRAGEHTSAEAFFRWVGSAILKHRSKIDIVRQRLESGLPVGKDDTLHTRFTLDGEEVTVDSAWGNFQIDGYGTWLWALDEHIRRSGNTHLFAELHAPVLTTLQYLELVWQLPNYDCWEEHPEYIHPYSLASVYAAFRAMVHLAEKGVSAENPEKWAGLAAQVKGFLMQHGMLDGRLVKHIQPNQGDFPPQPIADNGVDASLIGIAVPFHLLEPDHACMQATVQAIEASLHRPGGGVYRYQADVYYGGGEWPLLAAWLGWYYARCGKISQATALLEWIEYQADSKGCLAEQISDHTLAPSQVEPWVRKWGPIAKPLLWSHAMHIILFDTIQTSLST